MEYSVYELIVYFFVYAFLGWAAEVCFVALWSRRFVNQGFLNLPLTPSCGITALVLLLALPTLDGNLVLQFLLAWVVHICLWRFSELFVKRASRQEVLGFSLSQIPRKWRWAVHLVLAAGYLVLYLLIQPMLMGFVALLPRVLTVASAIVLSAVLAMDYICVRYAIRKHRAERHRAETMALGDRMTRSIWRRLEKAYPGIGTAAEQPHSHVFARGLCMDKLLWVFLVSAFLGDLIEMVYCRLVGGTWMSRSSVLYGPFSIVWGLGAVVLTVVLRPLAGKHDRHVFAAGFVVGGAYEYLCSVFTELVFGTVFWDYSHMPLNIGGRTNVLFCIFWGILSVVWVKMVYPPMERAIEKIPPLAGKLVTWALAALMVCNGALTCGAMLRYTARQEGLPPEGVVGQLLDQRYDDAFMENRWPNMIMTNREMGQ